VRILLITNTFPYPPVSGFPIRVYNLFRRIANRHEVWLVSLVTELPIQKYVSHLQEIFHDVKIIKAPQYRGFDKPIAGLRYLLAGIPPDLRFYHSDEMVSTIHHLVLSNNFDIVQIEDSYMAMYLETLPKGTQAKTILTFHDVVFDKYNRIYKLEKKLTRKVRRWLHSRIMKTWEPRYAEYFNLCVTVSDRDRVLLQTVNPRLCVGVVPNGTDSKSYALLPYRKPTPSLIYVGNMSDLTNIDAVIYFCEKILPHIRLVIHNVEFWIVGLNPSNMIKQLDGDGIHVIGQVDDVRPYYKQSRVCVIPLRAGGGTRLKILEAMALGRPVVSTSIGCEGLDVMDGIDIMIADTPLGFAQKTIHLLTEDELWGKIRKNARDLVENTYDWDALANQMMQQYDEIINKEYGTKKL